ncbi:MAG: hypothetical protein RLN75_00085, partial [Longimicrobiales bacterium]
NELDATTISRMTKWVLGELLRLKSTMTADETEQLLHRVVQTDLPWLWTVDGRDRLLQRSLKAEERVLVLLLARSPRSVADLQAAAEYTHTSRFKTIVRGLHKRALLDMAADGTCRISPLGESAARELVASR